MNLSKSPEKNCDLCRLGCGRHPVTQVFDGRELNFCCTGCVNVYAILVESGVVISGVDIRETELFQKSLELGLISQRLADKDPQKKRPEIPPETPVSECMLQISGMWCASCSWLIEHSLSSEPGVASAEVYFASDLLKVKYYPQYLPPDRIQKRITDLGYQASTYTGETEAVDAERKDLLLRLGVAVFFWLQVMTLNVGIYAGYFQEIPKGVERILPLVLMALTTPAVFYSAKPILRLAWRGLMIRVVRVETLLAMGILAAYFYSAYEALTGGSHVYFDTTCALVTLVLVGKWFERSAKARTSRAVTLMYRMMPKKARLMAGGRERFVSIEALAVGDTFVVKVGERIPADGLVLEGESHVDESLLTGEALPVAKKKGSAVVGGSVNTGGILHVEASRLGNESALAQIVKAVERAISSRSSIERTVDRVSRVFVPGVILVALATFVGVWMFGAGNLGDALMRGITVLVIACPCALGIATPLAITAAVGSASRQGILVSDSRVLETIRKVDEVVLDKTGTITEGEFALLEVEEDHLRALASLETYSEHPLGRALVRAARIKGLELASVSGVEVRKGLGISGTVESRRVFIGNRRMANEETDFDDRLDGRARDREQEGQTVAFYGWDERLQGLVSFGDRVKAGASELVRELQGLRIRVMVVSGDSRATTEWVASQVHADDYRAEALPGDKADLIEDLQGKGRIVAMVGDGINDAPALAAAKLGIAMGSGTDLAMKAAAMVLMSNDLHKIVDAFDLSRKTMSVIRQNLFWAFLYNTVGISLAVAGVLSPILAAGAMVVSSLSVIGNSLRLGISRSDSSASNNR